MHSFLLRAFVTATSAIVGVSAAPSALSLPTYVNLRVEGATSTIYEAPILTTGHDVTTAAGGTHHCDGTNLGANSKPGPTCTSALDSAAKLSGFTFDGSYNTQFDDFFITQIGSSAQTSTQFWGLLLNYQFTSVGGCQQEVSTGDSILWAYDAFNKAHFLKLTSSSSGVPLAGKPWKFTVTDGSSGAVISGATVSVLGGSSAETATSDENGVATLTFAEPGLKAIKAERADSLRSNKVEVLVL